MTTAARPTFDTARGGTSKGENDLSALSKQYSSRDLPSHTKLKYRQPGQDTTDEVKSKDFKQDLERKEREGRRLKDKGRSFTESVPLVPPKKPKNEQVQLTNPDADDPYDDDDEDEEEDSDEDDTAELLRELQRIKKERAEEQAKREEEKKVEAERIRTENLLKGNPLLNQKSTFKVKRRWDDDVIFKNCARDDDESKQDKGFINDTIRSEFHKKFMDKYIR
jgi:protein CWC15